MRVLFRQQYLDSIFRKKIWTVENIKMIKIMKEYYPSYNKTHVKHSFFRNIIKNIEFDTFKEHTNGLNDEILYRSEIHGLKHILNVCFFSYLIACNENLYGRDLDILLEISLYHDIGRIDDREDREHGHRGANKYLVQMKAKDIDMIIPAVIHAHSLLDEEANMVFKQYNIAESQYNRYLKLLSIVKDADALDRFRLCSNSLKPEYLRIEFSTQLISLACALSKVVWCDESN